MITLIQTEQTFNVEDDSGAEYTVTMTTDLPNGYIQYDVIDDDGMEVEDENVIAYLVSLIEETL